MDSGKGTSLWRSKWFIAAVIVILFLVVGLLAVFTTETGPQMVFRLAVSLVTVAFLLILFAIMLQFFVMTRAVEEGNERLEKAIETLEKSRTELAQIGNNTRLSDTAKAIAFRDADRQSLREAVFDKLHQQDFETTYKIIEEIAATSAYKELADELHRQADNYRDATDQERENQVIEHINRLLENNRWATASAQIERLIRAYPKSERALAMRQKLRDKKQQRKKVLLEAWDDAVKRQDTDRSLEILRELDMYLTPNEGLALQEAAREVFRTKLHNLGVQFSLAVSDRNWVEALEIGEEIMRGFPNSRMAKEIRERHEALIERVKQQNRVAR